MSKAQIKEYEDLKSGFVTGLKATSLEELPTALIKARIAKGLSQRQLANALGVKEQQIQRYESSDYTSVSLRRLVRVADALGLNTSEVAEVTTSPDEEASVAKGKLIGSNFPVKEMYRRCWFKDFTGSLDAALANSDELVSHFLRRAMPLWQPALFRGRANFEFRMNRYALLAWQCRVLMLVERQLLEMKRTYAQSTITGDWLKNLAKESRSKDGPRRAMEYLARSGIPLVVEPYLYQTYLDGAALLLPDGRPVIGLTLRYDRLDNFWFVLFHELAHVVKHLRKGRLEAIFDDLDSDRDDLESEADKFAGATLIPDDTWETALARYLRTEKSIRSLSTQLEISPAIIAGRIRREANNYVILGNLVGQGGVRKHFPDVRFGQ
ncbi:hypothetical protein ES703_95984 [subsurface metagenome]